MSKRVNTSEVIRAMAAAAGLPTGGFTVEFDRAEYILNHPQSQTWSSSVRRAVVDAVKSVLPPGSEASLM